MCVCALLNYYTQLKNKKTKMASLEHKSTAIELLVNCELVKLLTRFNSNKCLLDHENEEMIKYLKKSKYLNESNATNDI